MPGAGAASEILCHVDDQTELEAAAFRRLVEHLRERSDVQNIDLMELAGLLPELPLTLVPRGG